MTNPDCVLEDIRAEQQAATAQRQSASAFEIVVMHPIAAEMASHGITVNSVSPGYIATEMFDSIDTEGLEEALRLVPMRRYGKPEEIAAAMVFLASDDAAYITGQTIRVNGGMSMN